MRIALAQFDFLVGDVAGNARRIAELIGDARDRLGAAIVAFPELALCGYPPEDLLLRPGFLAACETALHEVARAATGIVALVGHPQSAGSVVFNAASVLRDGRVEQTYGKRELPNYAVFDERRYFAADDGVCVFEVEGVRVGLVICEDLWFPEPIAAAALAGAELVVSINASPFEHDKGLHRDALLRQRTSEAGVAIAYLNLVGGQDEMVFDGGSILADADGRLSASANAFEDCWLSADFDRASRRLVPVEWPADIDESRVAQSYRAIVRALRDYCGKNGFRTVVLGLSGGVDSALVLALACDALGAANVTAVRMPSRYTADMSNELAESQVRTLGARLATIPIESPFSGFLDALQGEFAGRQADTTEENLQSRIRGALLMALSNKFGQLVLTTGNKSEYAVGYATIYGDMCGGFAPIKDLYKTEVYELCHWRNAQQPRGAGDAIPRAVIDRAPSAELRPDQLDQDSLPPYEVLDAILRRHVEGSQDAAEIIDAGFDAAIVTRILELVRRAEWKRRQSAPGPKLGSRAFGRERRYPITSGWRS